jgi:hypothetical protein
VDRISGCFAGAHSYDWFSNDTERDTEVKGLNRRIGERYRTEDTEDTEVGEGMAKFDGKDFVVVPSGLVAMSLAKERLGTFRAHRCSSKRHDADLSYCGEVKQTTVPCCCAL